MTRELRVERDALKQAGGGFEDGARDLREAQSRLDAALQAEGKCWGADATGQAFEKDYLQNAQDVLKLLITVSDNVEKMKDGVARMAGTFGDAEDATGGGNRGRRGR
ncbi:hypothetical protein ACFY4C_14300 [Actinomadura viridis]|uniref:hypothetical protein n=1 Tax=Actinomadura viridis TaxID=58110 RepID=UPI0036C417EF